MTHWKYMCEIGMEIRLLLLLQLAMIIRFSTCQQQVIYNSQGL
jgi:hypothetical protein